MGVGLLLRLWYGNQENKTKKKQSTKTRNRTPRTQRVRRGGRNPIIILSSVDENARKLCKLVELHQVFVISDFDRLRNLSKIKRPKI